MLIPGTSPTGTVLRDVTVPTLELQKSVCKSSFCKVKYLIETVCQPFFGLQLKFITLWSKKCKILNQISPQN